MRGRAARSFGECGGEAGTGPAFPSDGRGLETPTRNDHPDGWLALDNLAVGFLLELEAVLYTRNLVRLRNLPGPVHHLVQQDDCDVRHMAACGGAHVLA